MTDKRAEAAARLKERQSAQKKRFKLSEGETTFRILPNALGPEKKEFYEYAMHSNIGPRKAYIRCGKNMKLEGDCWLCDVQIPKLEKSDKPSARKAAESYARKECFAIQIAQKIDDQNWAGPFLWEMPNSLAMQILGMLSKRDLAHTTKGYNLTASRTGTGFTDTRYGPIERDDDKSAAPENVLKRLQPFKAVVKAYDEEGMKNAYFGHEQGEEAAEEEEDTKPKASAVEEEEEEEQKPKSTVKKKPAVEETEEEEAVEEEEEEAPPPKKPVKKPAAAEEESEEEENFAEDVPDLEEEEETPPSKKPLKKKPVDEEEEDDHKKPNKKKGSTEEEEESVDEEEEEPPQPKAKATTVKKKPRVEEDDE